MTWRRGEQGVALALVLWLVILLGTIAATLASSTRGGLGVVLNARARTVARHAAESGITAAVASLER
jgi:type II secretory pathway component PulK